MDLSEKSKTKISNMIKKNFTKEDIRMSAGDFAKLFGIKDYIYKKKEGSVNNE